MPWLFLTDDVENILGVQVHPVLHWGAFLHVDFKYFFQKVNEGTAVLDFLCFDR